MYGDIILQELPVEAQDLNPVRIRIALIVNADMLIQTALHLVQLSHYVAIQRLPNHPPNGQRGGQYLGYYATKSEALVALERMAGKELRESYNYTLEQVYDCWRAEHFPTLTDKGREMYQVAWKRMTTIKSRKMRELRTTDYQGIINAMEDAGLSTSSAQKVKQLAGQLSKWAMREDIITTNYAQFIRIYTDEPAVRRSSAMRKSLC